MIDGELRLFKVKYLFRDMLVESDCLVEREVLLGLDELHGVSNVWDRGDSEETFTKHVDLAHILYCSVKII